MNWVRGDNLSERDQNFVLYACTNRYTGDHIPEWVEYQFQRGEFVPLQFRDDRDWLCNTYFKCRADGSVDRRKRTLRSHPTYPFNPELRKERRYGST
jgi:hypothetical protein